MQAEVVLESPRVVGVARSATRHYVAHKHQIAIYGLDWELERTVKHVVTQIVHVPEPDWLVVVGGSRARVFSGDLRHEVHAFDSGSVVCCAASHDTVAVASKRRIRWWSPASEGSLPLAGVKALAFNGDSIYCVQQDALLAADLIAQVVRQVQLRFSMGWTSHASICSANDKVVLAVDSKTWLIDQLRPTEIEGSFSGVAAMANLWLGFGPSAVLFEDSQRIKTFDFEVVCACPGLVATKDQLLKLNLEITSEFVVDIAAQDPKLALRLSSSLETPEILQLRVSEAERALAQHEFSEALQLLVQAQESPQQIVRRFEPFVDDLGQPDLPSPSSTTSRLLIPVIEALLPYLTAQHRRQLLQPLDKDVMEAVDSLLFKCYCVNRSPLVGALVRNKNYCSEALVAAKLDQLGRWSELAGFYKARNDIEKALDLLSRHHLPREAISFLEQADFGLVKKYAPRLLKSDPDLAADLFADSKYDPHSVYEFLVQQHSPYASEYLKDSMKSSKDPRLHQDMALWMLEHEPGALSEFLQKSPHINAQNLLPKIPQSQRDARVILLSKMGRHTEVIDLFIASQEFASANQYAEQHRQVLEYLWDKTPSQARDQALNSVGHLLDPLILGQLPDSLAMATLAPYFARLVKHLQGNRDLTSLKCALSSTHVAQSTYQLAHLKDQCYEVDATTTCARCKRRLGLAVTAAWKGSVVHYGCINEFT